MSLRIPFFLLIASLVACGGSHDYDDGSDSDTKAAVIPPVAIQGNFQNLTPEEEMQLRPPPTDPDVIKENSPQEQVVEPTQPRQENPEKQSASRPAAEPEFDRPVTDEKPESEKPAPARAEPAPTAQKPPVIAALPPKPQLPPKAALPAPPKIEVPIKPDSEKMSALETELLRLINAARAKRGIAPVKFNRAQSDGTKNCVGSQGHSEHMAQTRRMSHDQFPEDICLHTMASSENVGYASGDALNAVRVVHKMMMDEGPGGGHYDNIMNPTYNTVGLGFVYAKDRVLWITENFLRL